MDFFLDGRSENIFYFTWGRKGNNIAEQVNALEA